MFQYFNAFYAWVDEQPDMVDPYLTAVYFALLNRANRLGWKDKFAIVLIDLQETTGISSRTTMLKTLSKLEEVGFIKTVAVSKNQYKNRVICLPLNEKQMESTWKAREKHLESSWTHNKTIKTNKTIEDIKDITPVSIEPESAVILTEDSKPEKRKAHLFRNSKYHQNPELFRADFVNTTTFQRHPDIDPQLLFDDIQTSTDATDKYKYADWLAAAQNWCKRDVKRYTKRTFHANPADNRMAEQIARVIATPINPITGRPWNEPDTGSGQWPESFG